MGSDFRLGAWIVRPQRDCIEGGDGPVHIKPKAMAVLNVLAKAGGQVVSRDELFDSVWPGSVVTEDVLTQCIVELRKAFNDSARHSKVIETIPKVGFRLLVPVEPFGKRPEAPLETDPFSPRTRISLITVSTILLALVLFWYLTGLRDIPPLTEYAGVKSIAVLPFADMSAAGDQGYFADGMAEEMIHRLAQIDGLEVAGRTSSFHFKGRNEALTEIAAVLGVNTLLEGSVRRDGDRLRITAQLIDGRNGFHLWSRQYDRSFEEIFSIQTEIAESVADALSITLKVGWLGTLPGGTSSVQAYEELLLSKREQWKSTPESLVKAIDHIKTAIDIDPAYAQAWLRLAGLYLNQASLLGTERSPDAYLKSEQALAQALSLEPELPRALFMKVSILNKKKRWSEVEHSLNRGAGIESGSGPDLIRAYGGFLFRVGRIREAIPLFERARRLSPYTSNTARVLGSAYMTQGRIEEGLAEAERAFELEGFESLDVENGILAALSAGDRELIRQWLARGERYLPESRELVLAMSEFLDDREAALSWLRNTFRQSKQHDYMIAFWAAWHGDAELALDALQRYPAPMSFWHSVMPEVRQSPRFKDLVRQVDLEDYYREFGWNDFCRPAGLEDFICK